MSVGSSLPCPLTASDASACRESGLSGDAAYRCSDRLALGRVSTGRHIGIGHVEPLQ